jgi:predicted ATPase
MSYIIKVHGKNEATEKIMQLMLQLATENDFIDVYSEVEPNADLLPAIEERLSYLVKHNIEQLKSLAKCELIRRKMEYKRISKFPPKSAYTNIADRSSLFSIQVEDHFK